jgi:hypothetical protein
MQLTVVDLLIFNDVRLQTLEIIDSYLVSANNKKVYNCTGIVSIASKADCIQNSV